MKPFKKIASKSIGEKYAYDNTKVDKAKLKAILQLWCLRCHKAARAHYFQSNTSNNFNKLLTYLNVMASIVILLVTNASWVKNYFSFEAFKYDDGNDQISVEAYIIIASLMGLLLVVTTIIQFIQRNGEKAEYHRSAGIEYSNLMRKIERNLTAKKPNMSLIHNINRDYNHITRSYPLTSSSNWQEAGSNGLDGNIANLEAAIRCTDLTTLENQKHDHKLS